MTTPGVAITPKQALACVDALGRLRPNGFRGESWSQRRPPCCLGAILRVEEMTRPRRGPVSGTIFDRKDAERAESALRAARIEVTLEKVTCVICPGMVRRGGFILRVSTTDRDRAIRVLKENGISRLVEKAR